MRGITIPRVIPEMLNEAELMIAINYISQNHGGIIVGRALPDCASQQQKAKFVVATRVTWFSIDFNPVYDWKVISL